MPSPKRVGLGAQVWALTLKEFRLEWRLKYALGGIALYLFAVIFLVSMTFERMDDRTWVLLFWIVVLFTAANAVARSFVAESAQRKLYYYSLASAGAIMLSKIIYNFILMMLLGFAGLALFAGMMGFPAQQSGLFLATLALGGAGFSLVFTMVSAIASGAAQQGTLMAILGFPILVPVIRLLSAVSMISLQAQGATLGDLNATQALLFLAGLDLMILALAMLLFPYLWRE